MSYTLKFKGLFKSLVNPKILSSRNNPHVVTVLYDSLSSVEHKRRYYDDCREPNNPLLFSVWTKNTFFLIFLLVKERGSYLLIYNNMIADK